MRLVLLLPVLLSLAAPAYAEGARESRYGPTTPRQAFVATADVAATDAAAVAAARYDGPMLNWANKRPASTDRAAPAMSAPVQPAPLPARASYTAPSAPAAAPPAARLTAPPTSLYAPPRPAPAAASIPASVPAPAKDWSSYRSARMATAAPATATAPVPASAPAVAAAPPPRQVAANTGVTGARFYSVARESGLTPDPIPPAGPNHQVLIAADAPAAPAEDAAPMHGSADWLAAGARGDDEDEDDGAAHRAKTRNKDL